MEPQTPSLSFDLLLHNHHFPFPFLSPSPELRRKQRRSPSPSQSEIGVIRAKHNHHRRRRQFEPNTTATTNLNQLSIQKSQIRDHSSTSSGGLSHSSTSGTLSHSPPCSPSLCFSSGLTSKFWNWSSKSQVFDLHEQCTFSVHPECSTGGCGAATSW
ncbi:uncharacterized protein LOC110697853 isoform X2 [Chenopodium quinoa]|uniref:uncharacterized protein LOC110697853 isoform X2 n=1 Tax=Chenopodium quinoa TaxID=63459 RepID=UPI000B789BB6|nr:uncharacterized protein LOC110697853 isoform X2 [Chenopodium quinoa]